ncbi:WcaA Glycosyltransferases involved in cell wall biogenesis [Candidatus Methylopumilus universalis]|uniref:glycosyltransferase family 2 protein n=1 Tax=Candidatus Methylopumilus universalis TaxID=2588536 RepID=UPI003BEF47C4
MRLKNKALLSICVPTFNRRKFLLRLLASIPANNKLIEIVIIDDGSTDNTKFAIEEIKKKINYKCNYKYQKNKGRALALKEAIKLATGFYTIIMDSDDYFTDDGVNIILDTINKQHSEKARAKNQHKNFVFGVTTKKGFLSRENLPPENLTTNFIELRADYKIKNDLKEVVLTHNLKKIFNGLKINNKRLPTFLVWAKIAEKSNCLCINESVAVKEYLNDGMTANIFKLKINNPLPMFILYRLLLFSRKYKSVSYRMFSYIQMVRYAFHAKKKNKEIINIIFSLMYFTGFAIYLFDKLRIYLLSLIKK